MKAIVAFAIAQVAAFCVLISGYLAYLGQANWGFPMIPAVGLSIIAAWIVCNVGKD